MVVLIDKVEKVGEEAKCKWCDAIVHYERDDVFKIEHYYHNTIKMCEAVNCPKCNCLIYLCGDE